MQERVKLTPLTLEERSFSEENYPVCEWCIRINRLDQDSHDIAYMGYLHAVKKWHARPELRRYSFKTIANQTIRSYLSNEKQKAGRRIQTVSLEETIPGTEGLTYMETITEENIRFLKEDSMETKRQIQYDIEIPDAARMSRSSHRSIEIEMLINFLGSKHKTMCIAYSDKKEAAKRSTRFKDYKKNHKLESFDVFRFEEKVYIEKAAVNKRGAKNGKCED